MALYVASCNRLEPEQVFRGVAGVWLLDQLCSRVYKLCGLAERCEGLTAQGWSSFRSRPVINQSSHQVTHSFILRQSVISKVAIDGYYARMLEMFNWEAKWCIDARSKASFHWYTGEGRG